MTRARWTLHIRCTLFNSYIANLRMSLFQVYFQPLKLMYIVYRAGFAICRGSGCASQ